jgi:tetratricopeptide (TPR) repeat protein
MKRIILSLSLLSFFFVAQAQKSELAAAKNNYALFQVSVQTKAPVKKQLEALNLAKTSTDNAILNEKTKDLAELWAYRAIIYSSISLVDTLNKSNAEAAFKTAEEAIAKTKALDVKNEQVKNVAVAENNLTITMQNRGVVAYGKKDFKLAFESFKYIADVMPKDSTFNLYSAITANSAQLYPEAIKYYNRSIEINPKNAVLYQELGRIYLNTKDTANALKIFEQGRIVSPDNMGLIYDELNIYLVRGQASKQIGKIEAALAKDPKNKTLYFVAGIAYSANKQIDKSDEAYKKALEIDPDYVDAIYNLSVSYINKGNDYINEANKLPNTKASDVKYNLLKNKFSAELTNAVPLLEKARVLNPKDVNVLTTLREVYVKLNKLDKASEVKKAIDAL